MKVIFHKLFANLKKNNKKTQKHCRSSGLKAFGTIVMLFSVLMLCMPVATAEAAGEAAGEVVDYYYLNTGKEVNKSIKKLIDDSMWTDHSSQDYTLKEIRLTTEIPEGANYYNTALLTDGYNGNNITAYVDYETKILYYWRGTYDQLPTDSVSKTAPIRLNEDSSYMFNQFEELTSIDLSEIDFSEAINMSKMFYGDSKLTTITFPSSVNTKKLNDASYMFESCDSLSSVNLSNFDLSHVTTMAGMFESSSVTNVRIGNHKSVELTDISSMFSDCFNLSQVDLNGLVTDNVTNMSELFRRCSNLTKVNLDLINTQNVTNFYEMFYECSKLTDLNISNFKTHNAKNMESMFYYCYGLKDLDLSNFDTSNVTNMRRMFGNCWNLTNLDISNFKTENVTNFSSMFYGCSNITALDVSNFNTSKATNMSSMFNRCTALTQLNVSNFKTGKVTNFSDMFYGCSNITALDVSNFNTSKATNMSNMFNGCTALTRLNLSNFSTESNPTMKKFAQNCSNLQELLLGENFGKTKLPEQGAFLVSSPTPLIISGINSNMKSYDWAADNREVMYLNAKFDTGINVNTKIKKLAGNTDPSYYTEDTAVKEFRKASAAPDASVMIPENDVSITDTPIYLWFDKGTLYWWSLDGTPEVNEDSSFMFAYLTELTNLDMSGLDTSEVINYNSTFLGSKALTQLDVSNVITDKATDLSYMFSGCTGLIDLDVSKFNTSNATDLSFMFYNCSNISTLNVEGFNTEKATSLNAMFAGCNNLTTLDLSNFKTGKVNNLASFLQGCERLQAIDISGFDTSNVTNFSYMFAGCKNLTTLDITNFETGLADNMEGMFLGMERVTALPVSGLSTKNNRSFAKMFSGLKSVQSLELSNFDTREATTMESMFEGSSGLTVLDLNSFSSSKLETAAAMFKNCSALTKISIDQMTMEKVTNASEMFAGASELKTLNLDHVKTNALNNTNNMFAGCNQLYSSMTIENPDAANYKDMFRGASNQSPAEFTLYYGAGCKDVAEYMVKEKNTEDNVILGTKIYKIEYDLDGGIIADTVLTTSYTVDSGDIVLPVPVRKGYIFKGWVGTELPRPTVSVTIPSGSSGNRNYKAGWAKEEGTTIIYDGNGGTFDSDETNTVSYNWTTAKEMFTKYAHSANLSDDGTGSLGYEADLSDTQVIQIPGATSLNIDIRYQTEDATADWISIYEGGEITPNESNYEESVSGQLGGGDTILSKSFTVNGDTAQIFFTTDETGADLYGYHAVITGIGTTKKYAITSGREMEPTRSEYKFAGWAKDEAGKIPFDLASDLVDNAVAYAKWEKQTSVLLPGKEFKNKIQTLANNSVYNIKAIKKAVAMPDVNGFTQENIVTTSDSNTPVYMWYNYDEQIIYWWSENKEPSYNSDSSYMFSHFENLTALDFDGFKTDQLKETDYMFYGCKNLASTMNIDTSNITNYNQMFKRCSSSDTAEFVIYYTDGNLPIAEKLVKEKNPEDHVRLAGLAYKITYDLQGGNVNGYNPSEYKAESPNITLINPERLGYTFTGWTGSNGPTPQSTVTIMAGSTGEKNYTANWTPNTATTYKVNHWQLNLFGDVTQKNDLNYTLVETENLTGITDTQVIPETKAYAGFTAPAKQSVRIKPSGSQVVDYYYSRNGYKVIVNKGKGIDKVTGEQSYYFGEDVYLDASVKPGYTFTGWTGYAEHPTTDFNFTMPAQDVKLTANTQGNTYQLSYDMGTGNEAMPLPPNPTSYTSESDDIHLINPEKRGYTFTGWTGTDVSTPTKDLIIPSGSIGDRSYLANWKINEYTITYDLDGGKMETMVTSYNCETDTFTLEEPKKTGYTFTGWLDKDTQEKHPSLTIEKGSIGNRNLVAAWSANGYRQLVQARYENPDGTFTEYADIYDQVHNYGETVTWTSPANEVYKEATLSYKVTGEEVKRVTIYRNRVELILNGCINGTDSDTFEGHAAADVVVNGVELESGCNGAILEVPYGSTYRIKGITTTDGYNYSGLKEGALSGTITKKTIIRLKFDTNGYTLTYDLAGGTLATENPTGYNVETETFKLNNPTRENYDFVGWMEEGKAAEKEVVIEKGSTGDRFFVAKWTPTSYTITYNLDGGTLKNPVTSYTHETKTFELETPIRVGYTFIGWTGSNGEEPQNIVTIERGSIGNRSYEANWIPNPNTGYTINHWKQKLLGDPEAHDTLNYILAESEIIEGRTDDTVTAAVKAYEGFKAPKAQTITITGDGKTVVDYYYTRNTYQVTMDKDVGIESVTGTGKYLYGESVTISATPKAGYDWDKWTGTYKTSTKDYTFTMPASDVECIANSKLHEVMTYQITYNLNGGTVTPENPTLYSSEDKAFKLNNPTKKGYTFVGWTGSNGLIPQKEVIVDPAYPGNKTYTAAWSELPQNIIIPLGMADKEAEATANDEIILYPEIKEDGNRMNYNIKWYESSDEGATWTKLDETNALNVSSDLASEMLRTTFLANCGQSFNQYKYYITNEAGTIESGIMKLFVYEKYNIADATLTVESTGYDQYNAPEDFAMNNYNDIRWKGKEIPWAKETFKNVIVNNHISSVGAYTFKDKADLRHVFLSDDGSLKAIGKSAFENSGLLGITLPESVTTVQENSFKNCTQLRDIRFLRRDVMISDTLGTIPGSETINIAGYNREKDKYERKHGYPVIYGYAGGSAEVYSKKFNGTGTSYNFIPINDSAGNYVDWKFTTDKTTDTITNIYTETNVNGKVWIPKSIDGYLVEKIGDAKNEIGSKVNLLGKVVTEGTEIMSQESSGITALVIPDSVKTIGAAVLTNTPNVYEIYNEAYNGQTFTANTRAFQMRAEEGDSEDMIGTIYFYSNNTDFDSSISSNYERIFYDKNMSGVYKGLSWELDMKLKKLTVSTYSGPQVADESFAWTKDYVKAIIIKEKTERLEDGIFEDFEYVNRIENYSIDLSYVGTNAFENVGRKATTKKILKTYVDNLIFDAVSNITGNDPFEVEWMLTTRLCAPKTVDQTTYPAMFTFEPGNGKLIISPYTEDVLSVMGSYTADTIPWRCVKDLVKHIEIQKNIENISEHAFTEMPALIDVFNRSVNQRIDGTIFDVIDRYKEDTGIGTPIRIDIKSPVDNAEVIKQFAAAGFDITEEALSAITIYPGIHTIYSYMTSDEILENLATNPKHIVPVYVNQIENKTFTDAVPQPEEKGYRLESLFMAYGVCGDNLKWYLYKDGILDIQGFGDMYNYSNADDKSRAPWYEHRDLITNIVISDEATRIGSYAFDSLTEVKGFKLPANCTTIGVGAFENAGLTQIDLTSNLSTIEGAIFVGCNDLTEIGGSNQHFVVEDGILYTKDKSTIVEYLRNQLYNTKTGLPYEYQNSLTIPDTVTKILPKAFYKDDTLNKMFLPAGLIEIGDKALAEMEKLYFVDSKAGEGIENATESTMKALDNVLLNSASRYPSREVLIYRSNTDLAAAATAAGYRVRYYDDMNIDHINAHYEGEPVVVGRPVPLSKVVFDIVYSSGLSETTTGDDVRFRINGSMDVAVIGENKYTATYDDGYVTPIETSEFTVMGTNRITEIGARYNGLDVWYGEKFNKADVIVTLKYANGSLTTITGENEYVSFNKEIIEKLDENSHHGTDTVTVTYNDGQNSIFAKNITIGCSDYLESITTKYNGTKTVESTAGINGLTEDIKRDVEITLKWKANTSTETIDGADGSVEFSGGKDVIENKLQFIVGYNKLNRYSRSAVVNIPCASNIRDASFRYTGSPTTVGTAINPANITITLYYNDGSQKSFKADTVSNFKIEPSIVQSSGTNIVQVTYNPPGFIKSENLAVPGTIALPVKLIIVERPKKTIYQAGEIFDPEGLRVNCLYDNGDIRDVSDDIIIENRTSITPETKNVILSYTENRDGYDHTVKTYLSININQNQKALTLDKSFNESYEIEKILFRSKKTEDVSGAENETEDGEGKWSEIEVNDDSKTQDSELAATIKAGYGFELKVYTKYKTNRGDGEFRAFLQKSKWDTAFDNAYASVAEYINHKEDWAYLNDIYPQHVPTANPDLMYVKILKRSADAGEQSTQIGNKDFIVMEKTNRDEKNLTISEGQWYNSEKIFEFPLRTVAEDGSIVTTDDEESGDRRVYVSKDAADSNLEKTEYVVQILSPAWYGYEPEPKYDETTGQFIQNIQDEGLNSGIIKNWHNGEPNRYLHVAYEFSLFVQKNDDVHTHILQ